MASSDMQSSGGGLFPNLAAELKLSIFRFTLSNSAEDLVNLTSSCKSLYEAFNQNRWYILEVILRDLDSRELAIGTAHYQATIAPWKYSKDVNVPISQDREDYLRKVTSFCDKFLVRQGTELGVPRDEFTIPMAVHILETHLTIASITPSIAGYAVGMSNTNWVSSSVEITKISKLLYMLDISMLLFPRSPVSLEDHEGFDRSKRDHAFEKFWLCFAPWESAQAQCALETLVRFIRNVVMWPEEINPRSLHPHSYQRFVLRQGFKKLPPIVCDGEISDGDIHALREASDSLKAENHSAATDVNGENESHGNNGTVRHIPWQWRHHWFEDMEGCPHHPNENCYHRALEFDPDIFNKYDADIDDATARIWLWTIGCWTRANGYGVMFPRGFAWFKDQQEYDFGDAGYPYLWDIDHLMEGTKGDLPSLAELIRAIGHERIMVK